MPSLLVVPTFDGRVSQFTLVSIDVIDIEFNHRRMHLSGLRETDGSTMQSFQMRPEVQVVLLDALRLRLTDGVPLGG